MSPLLFLFACAPELSCGKGTTRIGDQCVATSESGEPGGDDSGDPGDSATGTPPLQVWILAGQSNMDGFTYSTGLPPSLRLGQDDVDLYWSGWGEFRPLQPGATQYSAPGYPELFGPEVMFGRTLADRGDAPVALVKHAVGGTDLAAYWHPGEDSADSDVGDGWATLMDTMDGAEAALNASGVEWEWAGFGWMQGESDALYASYAAAYEDNLTHLIARVREETGVPDLAVSIGLIACEDLCTYLDEVRAAQIAVADADPAVVTFETLDLPRNPYDPWHYDGPSMRVLGARMAEAALGLEPEDPPTAAVEITGGYTTSYDGAFTVGWRFTVNEDLWVTDVGNFDPYSDGLDRSAALGIWDEDTGDQVLWTTVPDLYTDYTCWRDGFWYTAVDPVQLEAGHSYAVGVQAWEADGDDYSYDASYTAAEAVTPSVGLYAAGGWLYQPTTEVACAGLCFIGPNFLFVR